MDWTNIISSIGFPIAACIYMAVTQRESIDKMKDVISNNTNALNRLIDRMDGLNHED